ncbi:MAG: phage tail protein, partial [Acinetobacter sp.]
MTAKYYVTLTDFGATQVAQAHDVASITLSQMVIGDANGIPYDPIDQKSRTALVNQRASVPVQSVTIEGAVTTVTATVAANIGGFNLHEIGLKDSTGQLVYIGNYHGG